MEIVKVKIEDLKPAEYNPRKMTEKQADDLKESIKRFGMVDPIIVNKHENRQNVVIGGHQRLKIAAILGFKEIPVVYVNLELKSEQELNLRLNKNVGEWDWDMLANFDGDILLDVGFDSDELDKNFNIEPDEKDDEIPEEPEEPKSKLGNIYQLGRHRLMCGDSTKQEDVEKLMDGKKADMVFTDPPYGIDYSGGRTQVVATKTYGKIKNDKLQDIELGNLINNVFKNNKSEADIYICVSPIMQTPFLNFIENNDKKIDAVIVWDKKNAGLGYMAYRRQTEFILFIKGGKFKKGDKSDFDLWSIGKDLTTNYLHGTQKPVALSNRAILNSSKQEDLILDLFLGSGSTLIACEKTNRICYGMEIEPKYIDVIIERWEKFTGQQAKKLNRFKIF